MERKIFFIIPLLLALLSKFVLADIILPSIGLRYIPIWLIIVINFVANFIVILFGLLILKELPKSKVKILFLTIIITIIGLIVDFLIEGVTYPGWNPTAIVISTLVFIAYVAPLSKHILILPFKKAILMGLMVGVLTNPIILMNIINPEKLQYSSVENCKTEKDYRILSTSCINEVAIQKRDIAVCNEIRTSFEEAKQKRLEESVTHLSEMTEEDISLKEERAIQECKSEWYKRVPKTQGDLTLCNLNDRDLMQTCVTSIAKNLKNPTICNQIITEDDFAGKWWAGSRKNICINEVAFIMDDLSVCDYVDFAAEKEDCISSIQNNRINCQRVLLKNPPVCGDSICTKEEDCLLIGHCFNGQEWVENCPYKCPMDCDRFTDFYKCVIETDGGKNIYEMGIINTTKYDLNDRDWCMKKLEGGGARGTDSCKGNDCFLSEKYCENGIIKTEDIPCANGCEKGYCIK